MNFPVMCVTTLTNSCLQVNTVCVFYAFILPTLQTIGEFTIGPMKIPLFFLCGALCKMFMVYNGSSGYMTMRLHFRLVTVVKYIWQS